MTNFTRVPVGDADMWVAPSVSAGQGLSKLMPSVRLGGVNPPTLTTLAVRLIPQAQSLTGSFMVAARHSSATSHRCRPMPVYFSIVI